MTKQDFGGIVEKYEKLVYTICYQFTKNHHTAQDLAQDTFLSAYNHIDSCQMENIKPWLARIATNKAKDYLKSAYNRKIQTEGEDGLPENATPLFATNEQPEDIAISRETVQKITAEIEALKEPYASVATLYFLKEKSVDEISQRLERPPKTVHTQLYRAKKILQEKFKGGGYDGTFS